MLRSFWSVRIGFLSYWLLIFGALLSSCPGEFFAVGAVLCIARCLAATVAFTHWTQWHSAVVTVIFRSQNCLSRGRIAPRWEQTTLEILLSAKPFHLSPSYFSSHSHHHRFPWGPLTLRVSTSSQFGQSWVGFWRCPLPNCLQGTRVTSWRPNPGTGLFSAP